VRRLLVTASVVPSSPILVTLMKEALSSSEMSVLARATRRNIPEDAILHEWLILADSFRMPLGPVSAGTAVQAVSSRLPNSAAPVRGPGRSNVGFIVSTGQ
jgi:hypothetical protein